MPAPPIPIEGNINQTNQRTVGRGALVPMGGSCDCETRKRLIPASHFLPDESIGLWWNEEDAVIEIEIVVSELACGLGSSQLQRRLLGKTTSRLACSDSADWWWDWSVAPNYRPSCSHVQCVPVESIDGEWYFLVPTFASRHAHPWPVSSQLVSASLPLARGVCVRHGPIPLSTVHWDLFLSIEQSPSLVDRMRNDRCAFSGETAVPHSAVCRRHDSGAELLLRVSQNVVVIRGSTTPDPHATVTPVGASNFRL